MGDHRPVIAPITSIFGLEHAPPDGSNGWFRTFAARLLPGSSSSTGHIADRTAYRRCSQSRLASSSIRSSRV
jgi:hypothetical protein